MALNPTKSRSSGASGKGKGNDTGTQLSREDQILMREIDEAVREDDTAQFVRKYGLPIIGAVIAALAGLGGYLWWDANREAAMEAHAETLISALDQVDADDFAGASEKVAPLLAEGGPAAQAAARFVQANAALEQGDDKAAIEIFRAIADDATAPQALRDLARIREVATGFDQRKPADVIARLKDLAVPDSAFFGSAAELTAMAHLENGNREEAGALFAAIAQNENQPETLRTRSRQMAGLLGVDAIVDVNKLLEDEGVVTSRATGRGAALAD
ncbi:MAG: tetratricopeptide repeat protein [Erythrobacter sp.]